MLVSSRGGGGGAGDRGGPSLLATLKVRVSRLEAALRDKEAEVLRLQVSTRATTVNELRIQAHTYYQEVVRLRNQLNISQHATVPIIQSSVANGVTSPSPGDSPTRTPHLHHPPAKNSCKIFHKRTQLSNNLAKMDANKEEDGDSGEKESAETMLKDEDKLRKSMMLLHDENNKLRDQVTTLINTMQNSEQGVSSSSRDAFERVLEKLEESKTEAGTTMLQCRMSELQGKETEWEHERASLRELITTLQDDRTFYKQTASKKESEMEALRSEVLTLQQEMLLMRQVENRRGLAHARGAHRPSPRTITRNGSGSGSSSDSTSLSSRQNRTQSSVRTPASSRHLPSGPTPHRSIASKASSEPRELPPRPSNSRKLMTTSATTGSEEEGGAAAANKRQQQLATSRRLAASGKGGATAVSRTPSSKVPTPATPLVNRSGRSNAATPSIGSSSRSASTVPSKTNSRTVCSSSPSQSSSTNRSNTSSATSSKSNSKKATPLSSPIKMRSSITSESKISKASTTSAPKESSTQIALVSKSSSRTARTIPKSSSSSSQSSRQRSKASSSQSSPSKFALSSPSKIAIASKSGAMQKRPGNEAVSGSPSSSPAAVVTQTMAETITEEDSRVLVELLRPEPLTSSSGEQSSPSGSLEVLGRQRTVTLHWDSGAGGSTDDSWGATGPRPLGVGVESDAEDMSVTKKGDTPVSSDPSCATPPAPLVDPPPARDAKIVESLDELKSLLCSHLHRQQQLNRLLEQEPQLLLQSPPPLQQQSRAATQRRRAALRHRRSPDGAEGDSATLDPRLPPQMPSSPTKSLPSPTISKIPSSPSTVPKFPTIKTGPATKSPNKSSVVGSDVAKTPPTLTKLASPKKNAKAARSSENSSATSSPGLVRQGTFNLDQNEAFIDKSCQGDAGEGVPLGEDGWLIGDEEQEDDRQALTDTISAHLARVGQLRELRD